MNKALILWNFDLERHVYIKTDALGYIVSGILSQMNSDQHCFNYVTHKNHSDFSKPGIGQ